MNWREQLKAKGKRTQVAEALSIQPTYLSRLTSGSSKPSPQLGSRIAMLLGLDLADVCPSMAPVEVVMPVELSEFVEVVIAGRIHRDGTVSIPEIDGLTVLGSPWLKNGRGFDAESVEFEATISVRRPT